MVSNLVSRWVSTAPGAIWREKRVTAATRPANHLYLSLSGAGHQTWLGAGGCFNELGWVALSRLADKDRKAVVKEMFDPEDGCRFSFCRIPIGASDYAAQWYSLNETDGDFAMKHFSIERDWKYLIPYIKLAQRYRPDLRFFASPWSPPTWLKYPKAMNNGTPIMDRKHLDALALYYVKFVDAYAREGIVVEQIHVINEPASRHHKFPMCEWDGEGMKVFIRDHLGPAFEKHGIGAGIWLGTLNTGDYNGFVNAVLSDPKAKRYIAGVGLQWDGRQMVRRVRDGWPEVPMLATENECGDSQNTWDYAQYVFDMMYEYIVGGVSGYMYWNMVLDKGGMSTFGWKQNSMVTIDPETRKVAYEPEFYLLKHLAHFVEPGAVRLGLSGPVAANAFAFRNPGGDVVAIVNNPFSAARTVSFEMAGKSFSAALEPKSFNTFVL